MQDAELLVLQVKVKTKSATASGTISTKDAKSLLVSCFRFRFRFDSRLRIHTRIESSTYLRVGALTPKQKNDLSCLWEPWREIRKYPKSTDLHPKSKDGRCNVSRWSVHQLDRHKHERRLHRRRAQSERDGTRLRIPRPCGRMLLPLMDKRRKQDPLRSEMDVVHIKTELAKAVESGRRSPSAASCG